MNKYILLLLLFLANNMISQTTESKFSLNFSYGLSIIDYNNNFGEAINLEIPTMGSFVDINLEYKVSQNKYLGLGFSRQQHAMNLNAVGAINSDTFIVLDNYRNIHQKDYVDIHFKTFFANNLNFNLGVFYFFDYMNTPDFVTTDVGRVAAFFNEQNRSDNLGLFIATGYLFKLNDFVNFGANAKLYYSLNGLETFAILPTFNIRF